MLISLKEKGGTRLPTDKSMIIIGKLYEITILFNHKILTLIFSR